MRVYSETLHSFAKKAQAMAREILTNETPFEMARNRFTFQGYQYPLSIIIFEGEKLGYFDSKSYQIGLNKHLAFDVKDDVLKDILRHEIAHYLTFIKYPSHKLAHGEEYQSICNAYRWNHAAKSSVNIEMANDTVNALQSESIIRKVKKLMNLASSSNAHEAQLATLKANTLLIKHNLKRAHLNNEDEVYTDTIHTQKKMNAKLTSIYEILGHFLLCPMLVHNKSQINLEVSGSKETLELGHYLFEVLDSEFERLWLSEKENHALRGLKAKNSFFSGMARGYNQKYQTMTQEFSALESKDLIFIQENLEVLKTKIYPSLRSSYSKRSIDTNSYNLGKKAGANLNLKKGIKNAAKIFRLGM